MLGRSSSHFFQGEEEVFNYPALIEDILNVSAPV